MSDRITREQFLAAGIGAGAAFGSGGAFALAAKSSKKHKRKPKKKHKRPIDKIEHVVILMQENRSFDNYFGTLAGVRGFSDPDVLKRSNGKSVFIQGGDILSVTGEIAPWRLNTHTSSPCTIIVDNDWQPMHDAWNGGRMDGWIKATGPYTMSYATRDDVPWHMALADEYLVCDRYHCSVLGAT